MLLLRGKSGPNKMNESYGMLCLSLISLEILFHIDGLTTPNQVWTKLETLFGKKYDLRGHQLKNELISLIPSSFKTIEGLTKFKSLFILLK